MSRPDPLRLPALALLLLLPLPPLALLCRGRSPSRLEARNLPAWERPASTASHQSHAPHKHGVLRANVKQKPRSVS